MRLKADRKTPNIEVIESHEGYYDSTGVFRSGEMMNLVGSSRP